MGLEIQYSKDIVAPWTAWMLYGAMGSGKTRSASTFPKPLFLVPANENSHLTLRQLQELNVPYQIVGKRADGSVVKVRAHLTEIFDDLEKRHLKMRQFYALANEAEAKGDTEAHKKACADAEEAFPWMTIVPESLTHLCDLLVEDVSDYGKKKMDQQGWGLISTYLRTMHSRLRNMDVHVVYTCLAKTTEAEGGGVTSGGPHLLGQMAEKLPSMCDVVAYLEELPTEKGPIYRTFFRKYRFWQARTRFGGFSDYIDSFDFKKLEALLA